LAISSSDIIIVWVLPTSRTVIHIAQLHPASAWLSRVSPTIQNRHFRARTFIKISTRPAYQTVINWSNKRKYIAGFTTLTQPSFKIKRHGDRKSGSFV